MKHCAICGADERGHYAILHGDFLCQHCYWWALDLLLPATVPAVRLVRPEVAGT